MALGSSLALFHCMRRTAAGEWDLKPGAWGARLAQSVEHMTLDLGVVSLSPTVGAEFA